MDLSKLVAAAGENRASDIILSPGSPAMLRVDGLLRPVNAPELGNDDVVSMLREIIPEGGMEQLERARELDFAAIFDGQRFRGNAYWRMGAIGLALRPIPDEVPTPVELGLPPLLMQLAQRSHGLMLFTGAAGQGKTTSQASLVDLLNRTAAYHIVTIEDPVEFVHRSQKSVIDQREIGTDTQNFPQALKHVLRQNPDVILVGEIRDPETARAALAVAETGHLVMSTVHANDSCQAVDRIVSMFPSDARDEVRTQLSLCLLTVVNQRLVRSKSSRRVLASEVLVNVPAVSRLIRDGRTEQLYSQLDLEVERGMQSMNRALSQLVERGTVEESEAARYKIARESDL